MRELIAITVINLIFLVLIFIMYRKVKKNVIDKKVYSLPMHTKDGKGVIIENKEGKAVQIFKKELL